MHILACFNVPESDYLPRGELEPWQDVLIQSCTLLFASNRACAGAMEFQMVTAKLKRRAGSAGGVGQRLCKAIGTECLTNSRKDRDDARVIIVSS